jgi:hypothetical protein
MEQPERAGFVFYTGWRGRDLICLWQSRPVIFDRRTVYDVLVEIPRVQRDKHAEE